MNHKQLKKNSIISLFFTVFFIFLLFSCAEKRAVTPPDTATSAKIPMGTKDVYDRDDVDWSDKEKQAILYDILMKEAEKFLFYGETKKTFAVYNRALTIATLPQKSILIDKINKLLTRTDALTLEELYEMGKLKEIEPFLMYKVGLNHILQKQFTKAKQILSSFENLYPLHEDYEEACALLKIARENAFNKHMVGCLLPLSGKYGDFGLKALNGIELALKKFQDKYNKKLIILIHDTGGDNERAVECIEEFCEKRVSSIIGPMVTAVAAGKIAEIKETPMIAMTQKKINPLKEKYLFSNFITPELQTEALVSYAFTDLNVKRFAILYPDDRYGNKYMNLFWDMVDKVGGEVRAVESYNPDDTDFGVLLKKMSGESYADSGKLKNIEKDEKKEVEIDFKAIFIPDTSTNVAQILPQLAYNDINDIYLLGTKLWHRQNLIKDATGYNMNAVIMEGYFSESKNEQVKKFAKDFKDLYGTAPGFIEAIAYDTASILFEILGDDAVNTKKDLRDQIAGGKIFDGVTGRTYFDEKGDLHKNLYYLTIQNRQFVEIKR